MKKEYLILLLAIVLLAVYLVMRPGDTNHLDLPQPAALDGAKIDKIVITKENKPIELVKKDDQWTIQPQGYAADKAQISAMLATVTQLSLSALVSESGSYDRYALAPDAKMVVQAFSGANKVREFDVGQVAPTFQHTFVKLENDPKVYHARGAFKTTFDVTPDSLRDKTVLAFDRDAITALVIQKDDKAAVTLTRKETPADAPKPAEAKETAPAPPKKEWIDLQGTSARQESVDQLIGAMANLQCDGFINDKNRAEYTQPHWSVTFKSADKSYVLSVFAKAKAEEASFPALSSASGDVFYLNANRVETFEKQLGELLPGEPVTENKTP